MTQGGNQKPVDSQRKAHKGRWQQLAQNSKFKLLTSHYTDITNAFKNTWNSSTGKIELFTPDTEIPKWPLDQYFKLEFCNYRKGHVHIVHVF